MNTSLAKIPVAILAGGLATRLRPITEKIPKSLVPVAGRPILAHQLEMLYAQGIRRAVLCIGFLGEMIQREFGSEACGIKLEYSFDGEKLLGTGGAIKRALPRLGEEFFVLYGDSYLPVQCAPVAEFFHRSGKLGLMTLYRNEGKYDASNVVFRAGENRNTNFFQRNTHELISLVPSKSKRKRTSSSPASRMACRTGALFSA